MTFQPVVVGAGLAGWSMLKATLARQHAIHDATYLNRSSTTYFSERFGTVSTADDVVSDRRLLQIVLGAYGLSDDLENRHFIKTILDEGVADQDALANKLSDRRYKALAKDFDFSGPIAPHRSRPELLARTIERYKNNSFEVAIGGVDPDMRLALTFQRGLNEIASSTVSEAVAWFQLMATPPLREVMQTALRLPTEFSNLDIDDQRERFVEKAQSAFGTGNMRELAEPELSERIVRRFLLMQQSAQVSATTGFETALQLLSAVTSRA